MFIIYITKYIAELILKINYFIKSSRFPKYIYIKTGTEIDWDNPIFKAWIEDEYIQTEIPASLFGSSSKMYYNAECFPLGSSNKILILLWLPDYQQKLKF